MPFTTVKTEELIENMKQKDVNLQNNGMKAEMSISWYKKWLESEKNNI